MSLIPDTHSPGLKDLAPPAAATSLDQVVELLAGLMDQFPAGVILCDTQGRLIFNNPESRRIWGGQAEAVDISDWAAYRGYHSDGRPYDPQDWAMYKCLTSGQTILAEEVHYRRFDGTHGMLLCNAAPLHSTGGKLVGAISVFNDVSHLSKVSLQRAAANREQALLHDELIEKVQQYARADEAKTTFLATTTHELKSPLAVIKGFAELLRDADDADPELRREAIATILARADELSSIVDRLLESSRIMAGETKVTNEPVDVKRLLEERVRDCAVSHGRRIQLDIEPSLPNANADPAAVVTVIDHLLDNAVKYSPSGTMVKVNARSTDGRVTFEVVDRGIGLTPQQAAQCFQKFWQGESRSDRRYGGAGIGLFIVKSLVEAMGGYVNATGTPGEGSTFTVALPVEQVREHEEATRSRKRGFGERSAILEVMTQFGLPIRGNRK